MYKVLLIEDDPMILDMYVNKFTSAGFHIETVSSGNEAISRIKENKFDLVILDLVLPEGSGIGILKEIKEINKDLKVIIFTNLNERKEKKKAILAGASDFIVKMEHTPSDLIKIAKETIEE